MCWAFEELVKTPPESLNKETLKELLVSLAERSVAGLELTPPKVDSRVDLSRLRSCHAELEALAVRVAGGEHVSLRCHCRGRQCHLETCVRQVRAMVTAAEQVMPMTIAATQSGRVPTTEKPPEEKETPGREQTRVTTARSLQASERQKRNAGTTRAGVVSTYLNTVAPSAKVMREALHEQSPALQQ